MYKPRRPEGDDPGLLGMFAPSKKRRGKASTVAKKKLKAAQKKEGEQWRQVHITMGHKHIEFLENAKVGRERLGPRNKLNEMILAVVEAVALSRINLRKAKSRKEVRERIRYFLNRGKDRDSDFIFAPLSDDLYDRVRAYANNIGKTVDETILTFVENQLAYVTQPTKNIRLPDKPRRRWSGPRARALKVDDIWWRNDVGRWEIEVDVSRVHFHHCFEQRANDRGWETFKRGCNVFMVQRNCLLAVEREFLLRKGERFVYVLLDRRYDQMHYRIQAHRRKLFSYVKGVFDFLDTLESVPVWDRAPVEKRMGTNEGSTVFRVPGSTAFPKGIQEAKEGDYHHRNALMERLIRKGIVVLRVEYIPPIRTRRRRFTPNKQQLKKLLKR